MGIYLSKYILGTDKNVEIKSELNIEKDLYNNVPLDTIKSIKYIRTYNYEKNYSFNIRYMEQFPNGNILITTKEDIHILDQNFTLLQKFKSETKNIFIKNDKIFVSYGDKIIDIWSYENNKINHLGQIKYDGKNKIWHIEIINDYDIIGSDNRFIFYYKANEIKDNRFKYEYNKIFILEPGEIDNFFITKNDKYLILQYINIRNYKIDIYSTKTFKKIANYKNEIECNYYESRNLYIIDEHTLGLQLKHNPMTIMEPPDILYIIDFQDLNNIKTLGYIQLKEYNKGFVTKEKLLIFPNTYQISLYDNIITGKYNKPKKEHKPIKLKKKYYFSKYMSKICLLNDNKFCIYYTNSDIDVYIIEYEK